MPITRLYWFGPTAWISGSDAQMSDL